jgi:hypothetical protein
MLPGESCANVTCFQVPVLHYGVSDAGSREKVCESYEDACGGDEPELLRNEKSRQDRHDDKPKQGARGGAREKPEGPLDRTLLEVSAERRGRAVLFRRVTVHGPDAGKVVG